MGPQYSVLVGKGIESNIDWAGGDYFRALGQNNLEWQCNGHRFRVNGPIHASPGKPSVGCNVFRNGRMNHMRPVESQQAVCLQQEFIVRLEACISLYTAIFM